MTYWRLAPRRTLAAIYKEPYRHLRLLAYLARWAAARRTTVRPPDITCSTCNTVQPEGDYPPGALLYCAWCGAELRA